LYQLNNEEGIKHLIRFRHTDLGLRGSTILRL